jgi:hypothetical protein
MVPDAVDFISPRAKLAFRRPSSSGGGKTSKRPAMLATLPLLSKRWPAPRPRDRYVVGEIARDDFHVDRGRRVAPIVADMPSLTVMASAE